MYKVLIIILLVDSVCCLGLLLHFIYKRFKGYYQEWNWLDNASLIWSIMFMILIPLLIIGLIKH